MVIPKEKINLKKIEEVEKNPERVEEVVWGWAEKSLQDSSLPWETAMKKAAEELGLNRAELAALIFGNEPFNDLAYGLGIYKNWRRAKFEREKVEKELFRGWKKVKQC